jgi:hypothetical protein
MVALHDTFASIVEAREAINRHVLDDGESYGVYKSDTNAISLFAKTRAVLL